MSKRGKGFELPNYTQTPNLIFDELLPVMSNAELRCTLVVVRHTLGWQVKKTEKPLSASEIARLGGLSLSSAKTGIKEGLQRGMLKRFPCFDEDNRATFRYGLNFEVDPGQLYQEIVRPRTGGTQSKFDRVFQRVFKEGTQSKFNRVPRQILTFALGKVPRQILTMSYKEQRNYLLLERRRRKKAAAGEQLPAQPVASSSEKMAAPEERIPDAIPAQAAYEAPQGATASFEEPAEPIAENEDDIWPEGLEDVPAARENIHEEMQPPEAPAQPAVPQATPVHDPAAVDARINQLTNGRWLGTSGNATPWIDETPTSGVDRHQMAQLVTLDRLEVIWAEARGEAAAQNKSAITMLLRKLEEAVLRRQQIEAQMAESRAARAAQQAPVVAAPKPQQEDGWRKGQQVLWKGQEAEIVSVTARNIEIYLQDIRVFQTLMPFQYGDLALVGERSLGEEVLDADTLEKYKQMVTKKSAVSETQA